jgi:hypothetical protein
MKCPVAFLKKAASRGGSWPELRAREAASFFCYTTKESLLVIHLF